MKQPHRLLPNVWPIFIRGGDYRWRQNEAGKHKERHEWFNQKKANEIAHGKLCSPITSPVGAVGVIEVFMFLVRQNSASQTDFDVGIKVPVISIATRCGVPRQHQ
jgi:hypothetical protein